MTTPRQLEEALARWTRAQPLRRAPPALVDAVLARIEQRAMRPWWRRDFGQWPVSARVVFALAACVPAVLACLALDRLDGQIVAVSNRVETSPQFSTLHALGVALELIVRGLSGELLLGVVMPIAALYAAVFGLGMAGYRVLYARR